MRIDKPLIMRIIFGIVLLGICFLIWRKWSWILSNISSWGTWVAVIVAGFLLYILRGRQRFLYGLLEIVIGILGVRDILFRDAPIDRGYVIGLLGSLYIIVRGQDNLGRGLRGARYKEWWERIAGPENCG